MFKKIVTILLVSVVGFSSLTLVGCGLSEAEKIKIEENIKRYENSIEKKQDIIKNAKYLMELHSAPRDQAYRDRQIESIERAEKGIEEYSAKIKELKEKLGE